MTQPTTTSESGSASKPSSPSGSSSEKRSEPTALLTEAISGKAREDKRVKAGRLLLSGRLRVLRVDSDYIAAECRGDSGEVYNLKWADQLWSCSCKARVDCSHLNALWAVVAVSRP